MKERLKILREKYLKLSQEEFGKRINIKSRSHISSLEKGTRNITDRIIADICKEYNVNEEWLMTGEGDPIKYDTKLNEMIAKLDAQGDPFKTELMSYIFKIDDNEWEHIGKHIKALADIYNKYKK